MHRFDFFSLECFCLICVHRYMLFFQVYVNLARGLLYNECAVLVDTVFSVNVWFCHFISIVVMSMHVFGM